MKRKNLNRGSAFDDFLEDEGILETVEETATKRVIAWQVEQAMKKNALSKADMAARMNTSRSALDRLLDPENEAVTLGTLQKAAKATGKRLEVRFRN